MWHRALTLGLGGCDAAWPSTEYPREGFESRRCSYWSTNPTQRESSSIMVQISLHRCTAQANVHTSSVFSPKNAPIRTCCPPSTALPALGMARTCLHPHPSSRRPCASSPTFYGLASAQRTSLSSTRTFVKYSLLALSVRSVSRSVRLFACAATSIVSSSSLVN